jgi:lysophospholipase L1-like esterase
MRLSLARSDPSLAALHNRPQRLLPLCLAILTFLALGALLIVGCANRSEQSTAPTSSRTESQTEMPPPRDRSPVIAAVGDSYTTGSPMDSGPEFTWSALMADDLRRDRPGFVLHVEAGGGSGYTMSGARGLTFEQLAQLSMPADPDVIIVFGSLNDSGSKASTVRSAAGSLMGWLRTQRPDAAVLVIGPPWTNDQVPANLFLVRDAVRDSALEAGATFIDPLEEGWFAGPNAALIGDDDVHPTDEGQRRIAELITPRVEQLLASRPIP